MNWNDDAAEYRLNRMIDYSTINITFDVWQYGWANWSKRVKEYQLEGQ